MAGNELAAEPRRDGTAEQDQRVLTLRLFGAFRLEGADGSVAVPASARRLACLGLHKSAYGALAAAPDAAAGGPMRRRQSVPGGRRARRRRRLQPGGTTVDRTRTRTGSRAGSRAAPARRSGERRAASRMGRGVDRPGTRAAASTPPVRPRIAQRPAHPCAVATRSRWRRPSGASRSSPCARVPTVRWWPSIRPSTTSWRRSGTTRRSGGCCARNSDWNRPGTVGPYARHVPEGVDAAVTSRSRGACHRLR